MQAVVNDLVVQYETAGKGKAVLLIHGWGDSLVTFRNLQEQLSASYKVIAVDLPGFGSTQPPEAVWTLDNYAAFVRDFLQKIGEPEPYAIVAHSNGGALTIRGLAQGTLQSEKLVLLASSGIRDRHQLQRLITKIIAKVGKVVTFWFPAHYKKRLRKKLYGVAGSDMLVAPHLEETFKKTVRQDVQTDARRLQLPVLMMYGEDDSATPVEFGEIFKKLIPSAQLVRVAKASHFVHHDQPNLVAEAIEGFLKS